NATPADTGLVEIIDTNSLRATASAGSLETPSAIARAGARVNVLGRSMVVDAGGTSAFVLTASGISIVPLTTAATQAPQLTGSAAVTTATSQPGVPPAGLISIFGNNLASAATSASSPLPTVLGGSCVPL